MQASYSSSPRGLGVFFASGIVCFFTLKTLQNHFSGLWSLTVFYPLGCKQTWNYIPASGQGSSWFCAMQRHGSEIRSTRALLKWSQWKLVSHQEFFVCNSLSWGTVHRRHFQFLFNMEFPLKRIGQVTSSAHITIPPPLLSPACLECSLFLTECLAEVFGFCLFYFLHFFLLCLSPRGTRLFASKLQHSLFWNVNNENNNLQLIKKQNLTMLLYMCLAIKLPVWAEKADNIQEAWRFKMKMGLY